MGLFWRHKESTCQTKLPTGFVFVAAAQYNYNFIYNYRNENFVMERAEGGEKRLRMKRIFFFSGEEFLNVNF